MKTSLMQTYGMAAIIFLIWLIAGIVLDQIVASIVRNYSKRHSSRIGYAFAKAFHGLISWMAGLIGFWIAFFKTPLPAQINRDLSIYLKLASVLILTIFLARIASALVSVWATRDDPSKRPSSIFPNITRASVYVIGIGVGLGILGVSLTPILTALGVGGLAIGLALQPTLDNLFSGIQIIASNQIRPGDFVQLESGSEGVVEDVQWRNTTIRRASGEVVIVPNSVLGKSAVVNYSRNNSSYKLVINTTVAAKADPLKVQEVALTVANEIMKSSPFTYKTHEPSVSFVKTNGTTGLSFNTVLPIMSYTDRFAVQSQFVEHLDAALKEAGIHYHYDPLLATEKRSTK